MRGRGVQAEVLLSLALAMMAAMTLLVALLLETQRAQIEQLQGLIGRALHSEAEAPTFEILGGSRGVLWWRIHEDGRVEGAGGNTERLEGAELQLAERARLEAVALFRSGRPWEPINFATPVKKGAEVAVARIRATISGGTIAALVIVDCLVFVALGAYLLRRWVVLPFRRLARAAEAIREGALETRVEVEGQGEAAEVARAFNRMSEALEERTGELEKVVVELRESNRNLSLARVGLDRAERLAAVGSLAAGVAHEVGNPMGALLAYLDLARRDDSLSEAGSLHLRKAGEQGTRVRAILRQLLDFSRPPRLERGAVALLDVAGQTLELVRTQARYSELTFVLSAEEQVPEVSADRGLLLQILLNLVLNAADAVSADSIAGASGASRVEVRIRRARNLERSPAGGFAGEDGGGDYIECEVADNGPGVDDAHRERIFDPFFTTKDPGEGTGLGLANCQRFAEELGGSIEVGRSELGGASFVLTLVRYGAAAGPVIPAAPRAVVQGSGDAGGELDS
jgi:signal transduction histidine kinase